MAGKQYKSKEVQNILSSKLEINFRSNKEVNGWFEINGVKKKRLTIPNQHGSKSIPKGTFGSMARQMGLAAKQFEKLIDCSLSKQEYIKIID